MFGRSTDVSNDTRYRAAALGALLARHYPDATPHAVALVVHAMQAATRRAKKFAEDRCNYDLGDPDDKRSSYSRRRRAQDKAEIAINRCLGYVDLFGYQPYGDHSTNRFNSDNPAKIDLGGDPRGACGRLIIPGMAGDGWGEGFAIY